MLARSAWIGRHTVILPPRLKRFRRSNHELTLASHRGHAFNLAGSKSLTQARQEGASPLDSRCAASIKMAASAARSVFSARRSRTAPSRADVVSA